MHKTIGTLTFLLLLTGVAACDSAGGDPDVDRILALEGDAAAGAGVFADSCGQSFCHGADGSSGSAPDLPDRVPNLAEDEIISIVINGRGSMPAQSLSDQEVADAVTYVIETF